MGVHIAATYAAAGIDVTLCSRDSSKAKGIVTSLLAGKGWTRRRGHREVVARGHALELLHLLVGDVVQSAPGSRSAGRGFECGLRGRACEALALRLWLLDGIGARLRGDGCVRQQAANKADRVLFPVIKLYTRGRVPAAHTSTAPSSSDAL